MNIHLDLFEYTNCIINHDRLFDKILQCEKNLDTYISQGDVHTTTI